MVITTRCVTTNLDLAADGTIFLRIEKQIVKGDRVMSREPHRVPVEPGQSLEDVMKIVNADLEAQGFEVPTDAELARAKRIIEQEHTPEVVTAFKAFTTARDEFNAAMLRGQVAGRGDSQEAAKTAIEDLARTKAAAEDAYQKTVEAVRSPRKLA